MEEILNTILNFPAFPAVLQKKEIGQLIVGLIISLEPKMGQSFTIALQSDEYEYLKKQLRHKEIEQIALYLNEWHKIACFTLNWSQQIIETWQTLIDKELTAEELLLLTIHLLPDNIILLHKMATILDQAIVFEIYGMTAYIITNLYCAIKEKLAPTTPLILTPNISLVLTEIRAKVSIIALLDNSEKYKLFLFDNLKNIIKKDDYFRNYYLLNEAEIDKDQLIEDLQEEFTFHLIDKPTKAELNFYIQKYLLLNDMIFSLQKNSLSTWKKSLEFSEKFLQHAPVFYRQKNTSFFVFFKYKTEEDVFLAVAENFTQQTKEREKIIDLAM